jgi:hypothetical protein
MRRGEPDGGDGGGFLQKSPSGQNTADNAGLRVNFHYLRSSAAYFIAPSMGVAASLKDISLSYWPDMGWKRPLGACMTAMLTRHRAHMQRK